MNPDKQRIAIAEACGWTFNPPPYNPPPFSAEFKAEALLCWVRPGNRPHQLESPPDYLNDLNAMHEAEKVLTDDQAWEQIQRIVNYRQHAGGFPVLSRTESRRLHSATAAQRAEAFLRTIGKWEDEA